MFGKDVGRQHFYPLTDTVKAINVLTDRLDSQNPGTLGKIPVLPETPENIIESIVFSCIFVFFGIFSTHFRVRYTEICNWIELQNLDILKYAPNLRSKKAARKKEKYQVRPFLPGGVGDLCLHSWICLERQPSWHWLVSWHLCVWCGSTGGLRDGGNLKSTKNSQHNN